LVALIAVGDGTMAEIDRIKWGDVSFFISYTVDDDDDDVDVDDLVRRTTVFPMRIGSNVMFLPCVLKFAYIFIYF
jgi:hypothetical protein